jgi:DUF971 family protein
LPATGGAAGGAHPESLRRLPDGGVEIGWSDGVRAVYPPRLLRDACPCATCREERAAPKPKVLLQVLSPEETRPLVVAGMRPVGQYAYAIEFSDGHSSGIYTLDYLRELG